MPDYDLITEVHELLLTRCSTETEGRSVLELAMASWSAFRSRSIAAPAGQPKDPDLFDKLKEEGLYPEQMAYKAMKIEGLWECEPYHHPLPPRK